MGNSTIMQKRTVRCVLRAAIRTTRIMIVETWGPGSPSVWSVLMVKPHQLLGQSVLTTVALVSDGSVVFIIVLYISK